VTAFFIWANKSEEEGMVKRKIGEAELNAWEAQQKRGFIAGRLKAAA